MGADAVVVGAGGRVARARDLGHPGRPYFIEGLLRGRVPLRYSQLVRCPSVSVQTVTVEVAVVERHKDKTLPYAGDAGFSLELPARRLDTHHVAFLHSEALCVRGRELDPRVGRSVLELRGASGLGAGVEVVDGAPSGVGEGVLLIRLLVRRLVLGGQQ